MRHTPRTGPLMTALMLAMLVACSDSTAEPPLASRTITAECALTFTAPPTVPPPPSFTQQDQGTCTSAVLGELRYAGELVIDVVAGTQRGTRTFTSPDGSSFRATSEGTSVPRGQGLIGFAATLRVLDGTGRFAGITGELRGEGTANQITRTTAVTFVGTLTYRNR